MLPSRQKIKAALLAAAQMAELMALRLERSPSPFAVYTSTARPILVTESRQAAAWEKDSSAARSIKSP